jgi:hypothetical protein
MIPAMRIRSAWVTPSPAGLFVNHYTLNMRKMLSPAHAQYADRFSTKLFSPEALADLPSMPKVGFHWVAQKPTPNSAWYEVRNQAVCYRARTTCRVGCSRLCVVSVCSAVQLPVPLIRHVPVANAPARRSKDAKGVETILYEISVYMNRAAEEMSGYSCEEYIALFDYGTSTSKLFHPNDW